MSTEEQDTILLVIKSFPKTFYYVVSLDILRLFPLSYLNQLFLNGIPIGSFLTGYQVKELLRINTSTLPHLTTPSSSSIDKLCNNEVDLHDKLDDEIYSDYSVDDSMKYLFEKVEKLSPMNNICLTKGILIETDIDTFVALGMKFQAAVFKEFYKTDGGFSTSDDDDKHTNHSDRRFKKEFMFLREDVDLYVMNDFQKTAAPHTSLNLDIRSKVKIEKSYLIKQTIEQLLEIQSSGVAWGLEETTYNMPKLMIETLQESGHIGEEPIWDLQCPTVGKKATFAIAVMPLPESDPFSLALEELDMSSELPDEAGSDASVEILHQDCPEIVTQVVEPHHGKNFKSAIENREPMKIVWWQRLPIHQTSTVRSSSLSTLNDNDDKTQIGILWIRRSWQLEFSVLE